MCVPSSNSLPRYTVPPGRFSEAALCCNQELSFSIQKTTRHWLLCRAHFSISARLEIVLEAGRVCHDPCRHRNGGRVAELLGGVADDTIVYWQWQWW